MEDENIIETSQEDVEVIQSEEGYYVEPETTEVDEAQSDEESVISETQQQEPTEELVEEAEDSGPRPVPLR